jgi:hypothetical protein
MSKSIYPSVPSPGSDMDSIRATLDAVRQSLTMVIINAQNPSSTFAPSSAAQVFVTNARLNQAVAQQLAAGKNAVGAAAAPAAARAALGKAQPFVRPSLPTQVLAVDL